MKPRGSIKKKKKKDEKEKDKDKDKNIQNNIILPTKHDRIDNLNYYSEEIAKEIIDKIISLSFTKLYIKKIDEIIPQNFINQFIKSTNQLIEIYNINHDIDDMYSTIKLEKNYTFNNNKTRLNKNEKNEKN